jgi:hypothetical protein
MRGLILLAVIVLICVLVGWITFTREPGRATINLETQEIRDDTKEVMNSGAELLQKAGDEIDSDHRPAPHQSP